VATTERDRYEAQKTWDRNRFEKRYSALVQERTSWEAHWRELSDNILPRRGRFLGATGSSVGAGSVPASSSPRVSRQNRGDKRNQKIINGTATTSARTLRDGMLSGLISPARPWLMLSAEDDAINEIGAVKQYLQQVERLLYAIFRRSGFYGQCSQMLEELCVFGTGPMSQVEDFDNVCRFQAFTAGEFCVANGPTGLVETFYRDVQMTCEEVVGSFVFGQDWSGAGDWSRVSQTVRNMWDQGNYDAWIPIRHAVQCWHGDKKATAGRKYAGVYWEPGADDINKFLEFRGFEEFPVHCPRWHVLAGDVYGRSPGMDALGDVKQLQLTEKRKAQQLDFATAAPKLMPSNLNKQLPPLVPGQIYPIDPSSQAKAQNLYDQQIRFAEVSAEIQAIEQRIQHTFFVDLFLMISGMDSQQPITAREVEERHEEKLLMLGPVLQQLEYEFLNPLIDRTWAMCERAGILPTPPDELRGKELKVEYISILAQAQKRVSLGPLNAYLAAAAQVASIEPAARYKLDGIQWMDEYGAKLGVPQTVIREDDAVAALQQQDAQQAAMQQMAAAAPGIGSAMKDVAQSGLVSGQQQAPA